MRGTACVAGTSLPQAIGIVACAGHSQYRCRMLVRDAVISCHPSQACNVVDAYLTAPTNAAVTTTSVPTSGGVSLVLGSGGARGYAHIGVIEQLLVQGLRIQSIAGSSMGALVGGVYAAGKLDQYRNWVSSMQKYDVWRMLDWTLTGGGFIKGDRIMNALRELVGETRIEDLSIPYTAVAVDIDTQREVWLSRGSLFDAIRASIATPAIFRPYRNRGRTLVDGGAAESRARIGNVARSDRLHDRG